MVMTSDAITKVKSVSGVILACYVMSSFFVESLLLRGSEFPDLRFVYLIVDFIQLSVVPTFLYGE